MPLIGSGKKRFKSSSKFKKKYFNFSIAKRIHNVISRNRLANPYTTRRRLSLELSEKSYLNFFKKLVVREKILWFKERAKIFINQKRSFVKSKKKCLKWYERSNCKEAFVLCEDLLSDAFSYLMKRVFIIPKNVYNIMYAEAEDYIDDNFFENLMFNETLRLFLSDETLIKFLNLENFDTENLNREDFDWDKDLEDECKKSLEDAYITPFIHILMRIIKFLFRRIWKILVKVNKKNLVVYNKILDKKFRIWRRDKRRNYIITKAKQKLVKKPFIREIGRIGALSFSRRKSNIFLLFRDLDHKTIVCKSTGMSGVMGTKRRKKTPQSFEQIIKVVYPYLRLYSIVSIYVYVYRRPNAFYYTLMRLLDHYGMGIKALVVRRHVAHNGCRGRKLRRV